MRGSVRPCWTGSRIGLTFWRRARNRIGSGGRRKSEIDQPKRRRAKATSCGNDGPWKEWKTQEQVSHSSHRPWKSARAADSHIHHSYGGGDGSGCGSPHTASLKQQHPKVGRNKPPKWAKRSCQTQPGPQIRIVIFFLSWVHCPAHTVVSSVGIAASRNRHHKMPVLVCLGLGNSAEPSHVERKCLNREIHRRRSVFIHNSTADPASSGCG